MPLRRTTIFDRLTAGGDASIALPSKIALGLRAEHPVKTGVLYPVRHNDGRSMSPATRDKMIGGAALFAAFAYFGAIIGGFIH